MSKYDDIIELPYIKSTNHPHMSMHDRAAQFASFAALTGFGDMVDETGRHTEKFVPPTEEEKKELDTVVNMILESGKKAVRIRIYYFLPDGNKEGGTYIEESLVLKKTDCVSRELIMDNGVKISFDFVYKIITEE